MSANKTAGKHIDELHFEHKLWTSKMNFYLDEISIFENRLSELVQRNTKVEVTSQIEHFQNQFIRQREVAQEVVSKSNDHEKFLVNYAKDNPVAIDHVFFADHTKLRDEVETFDKIFSELKKEFLAFVSKWL